MNTGQCATYLDYNDYEHDPLAEQFYVYSVVLDRVFSGSTLTIARTRRSEAERIYREHHAKND